MISKTDLKPICLVFVLVKSVLFTIPQLVVKQYDTSSQLIFTSTAVPSWINYILSRLIVWDTVFFIRIAQRGYLYEQEWAFGWLWHASIRSVGDWIVLPILTLLYPGLADGEINDLGDKVNSVYTYAIASLVVAHICHLLAVVTLYIISKHIQSYLDKANKTLQPSGLGTKFPLIVSLLYIISPGGIFMSAGYSETLFAFLSFIGVLLREMDNHVASGACFMLCCGVRGNGILWGIIFLNDFYEALVRRQWKKGIRVIIGGSLIAIGFLAGQVYAYMRYCPGREWCSSTVPLIYGYVQSKYWNVGFLKYWRTWQIPNFLFAFPTWFLFWRSFQRYRSIAHLRPYVIIQMIMLVMSLFIWHVQIITRVGTCMPLVYWHIAERIAEDKVLDNNQTKKDTQLSFIQRAKADFKIHEGLWEVRYMITWIGVQAVLFASFIPPA
ncbi:hypothetical protein V1512DRAFT_228754 [Lipomyces arxii]|uniref:uncharacterized protein n=1 Tax=Lipomyces arxii TaxID=56418 RepID=UPI0034CED938